MLIILGGLPGTGKSTIGKKLAEDLNAVYLRIDSIEQAIKNTHEAAENKYEVGPEGYMVAYAIARDNLLIGLDVVADSVNSIDITRDAWRRIATEINKSFIEVEFICTDKEIHKKRIEMRETTIEGLQLPTWQKVLKREYEPWETKHIIIDTAICSVDKAVNIIIEEFNRFSN